MLPGKVLSGHVSPLHGLCGCYRALLLSMCLAGAIGVPYMQCMDVCTVLPCRGWRQQALLMNAEHADQAMVHGSAALNHRGISQEVVLALSPVPSNLRPYMI
jgi:hypothetical protein